MIRIIYIGLGAGGVLAVLRGIISAGVFDGLDLAFLLLSGALIWAGLRGANR